MLTKPVLELFQKMLDNSHININAPDFEESALIIIQAKRELSEALAETET